ncbi:hypothetical protein Tco_1447603 [Tanacetum coccineum]
MRAPPNRGTTNRISESRLRAYLFAVIVYQLNTARLSATKAASVLIQLYKTGLGYSTQLNELSSNHETSSENSLSIFDGRSSDDDHILKNDRFSKNGYKAVPPPITGDFCWDLKFDDYKTTYEAKKKDETIRT